ncbi:MAG: hypothetical protein CVU44_09525 [Chloroflexi bacterium HGW-Chloroflexi-6]|nr:MAG: hypothetical protein CVU44_09525 [Chloroflexi bacterium HGW-Chloroflexi-6]
MQNKRKITWLIIVMAVVILLAGVASLPSIWPRVTYHFHQAYTAVKYWLYPPSEIVFVPSTHGDDRMALSVAAANTAGGPAHQPTTEPNLIPSQATPEVPFTPNLSPTSLPSSILLQGITKERQFMNNCGPATLSMYLSYYGWGKDQIAAAKVLRPNAKDVNVMPYELVDFVNENTAQHALWRYGGDLQTIKNLLNAGFPVMIEKSFEPYSLRNEPWMGHYNLVVGYDDEKQILTVQDSYLMSYAPWGGEIPVDQWDSFIGFDFSYSELERDWRAFNFVFIVVYPPEKENEVLHALGPLATEAGAYRRAYDRAMQETVSLTDVRDQFFAWFNAGTSQVSLKDYSAAATTFDTAFSIYPDIKDDYRPYRILWYETGPYEAYYASGRYQDVINLANQTLGYMSEPALEESYYWRALSYVALGDTTRAITDLRASLEYHPGFAPSVALLKQLGKTP